MPSHDSTREKLRFLNRLPGIIVDTGDPVAVVVADALAMWVAHDGPNLTFDEALGLRWRWRERVRIDQRNARLLELAARSPCLKGRPLAKHVATVLRWYEASAWRQHNKDGRPSGDQALFYDILRFGKVPGVEALHKIFNGFDG